MNCPSCSAPLLFGATSCSCGYNTASAGAEGSVLEVSYWEALRAYWRVYWPAQIAGFVVGLAANQALFAYVQYRRNIEPLSKPLPGSMGLWFLVFQLVLSAVLLFLLVSRLVSRPYRGFSLIVVQTSSSRTDRLNLEQRTRVWFFLWWRQLAASLLAVLLAAPLNVLLALMGLNLSIWVANLAALLIIGPVLVKMLVGNPFPGFSMEARRG